jgi:hypothetical protein
MTNKTHDYSAKEWGHSCEITSIEDGGLNINLAGWGKGIASGDFIVIKNGEDTTRYKFKSIKYCNDPIDMWFGSLIFAPRSA